MEKLDLQTPNITDENVQKISNLFPNCVTEAADGTTQVVDFDLLKQELSSNIVEGNQERYQLTWPGKAESLVTANTPINKTLRPNREESKDFDNTENLYIEGDNLEVLKLLQETYLGKIKMIYIDPPYNTGKDFVYKDNFTQDKSEYDEESGNVDEEGGRLVSNPDSNGRYHSDWLSMMYPRLKLARNLLKDDGVIFISIDDNEAHNLRKICDEIFGENNFAGDIVWDKKASAKGVPPKNMMVNVHEYILVYTKNSNFKFLGEKRTEKADGFKNPDKDSRGPWRESNIKSTTKPIEDSFTIIDPNTGKKYTNTWAFSKESLEKMIAENRILWKESLPKQKEFMLEMTNQNKALKSSWGVFDPQSTTVFLKKLIKEVRFDNPKPINLMKYLTSVTLANDDVILDFFSGSATTAHAIIQLNAENGGNRKFIMVQIPEATDEKSEAYRAGYKTIAEIGKERIRRAGEKIKKDNADKEGVDNLDIGFRVLKVDSPNMKDVYFSPDNTSQDDMFDLASNIKDDRSDEDLLFMVLLDWGIDLSVKIERKEIAGKPVYFAGSDFLAACFAENLDEDFIKTLVAEKPRKVVLRDSGFASSSVKINVEQIFKQANIEVKVI